MTDKGKKVQRLRDMAAQVILKGIRPPASEHVTFITEAYDTAKVGDYNQAYELSIKGLLGEDSKIDMETTIGILQALQAHYGIDTQKGKEIGGILKIVAKYRTVLNHDRMKIELRQYRDSLKGAEARQKGYYRPGWASKVWEYATEVIKTRFKTAKERKKALRLVKNLAIRLTDKEMYPVDTLEYGIPSAARAAKDVDELRLFIDLATRLVDKRIDPAYILQYGIPAIANAAKNTDELKLFIDLAARLVDKRIYPAYILQYVIPPIAKLSKNIVELEQALLSIEDLAVRLVDDKRVDPTHVLRYGIPPIANAVKSIDELKEVLPSIENLAVRLADKRMYPTDTLEYGIPVAADTAKNTDELRLFIDFAARLADKRIDPAYTLQYGIPKIVELAKTMQELKDMCDALFDLTMKFAEDRPRLLHLIIPAISHVHIIRALELKKNYGDFFVKCVIKTRYRTISEGLSISEQYVSSINIHPFIHLTQLITAHVLFIDAEIVKNPAGFKKALEQLRDNNGNVAVILLTSQTKDAVIASLERIDLAEVQFKAPAEFGLQDLKWDEDGRMSLIDGINSLRCILLTRSVSGAFKGLQKTRNQL